MKKGSTKTKELLSIEVLRAVAVLLVLVAHAQLVHKHVSYPGEEFTWLLFGRTGVDLFFIISGYIISFVTDNRQFQALDYTWRRFTRIYPFYFFFTTIAYLMFLAYPPLNAASHEVSLSKYILSILIIPQEQVPILAVGWSLEHEILFYTVFGALLAAKLKPALPATLFALFLTGIPLYLYSFFSNDRIWDYHLFSPVLLEFLTGVLIYKNREKIASGNPALLLITGALIFAAFSWWYQGAPRRADSDIGLLHPYFEYGGLLKIPPIRHDASSIWPA